VCLEYLNQNSGAFAVIFSGAVAIAAIVYAYLTSKLTSETKKMRKAQTEPKVAVTIQPEERYINFIDMIIQNIGSGLAYDIKLRINPDFEYDTGKFLSQLGIMKKGLNCLLPHQKYEFFLTSMTEDTEKKLKTSFEINVTYKNGLRKPYEDTYPIDLSHLEGLVQLGEAPLYTIAKNVEKIAREMSNRRI